MRALLKATMLRAVNEAMFFAQPAVLSCLVFGTYYLLGNVLNPQQVCRHIMESEQNTLSSSVALREGLTVPTIPTTTTIAARKRAAVGAALFPLQVQQSPA